MGVLFEAKNEEQRVGVLENFIQKAGGCAVIDGGFATQLEIHGADINDPLWSALCLINSPHLISKVDHIFKFYCYIDLFYIGFINSFQF